MHHLDSLYDYLTTRGYACSQLPKSDKLKLQQLWRRNFAGGLHAATGNWILDGLDVHTFERGFASALTGEEALAEYRKLPALPFYVLPSDHGPAYLCENGTPPELWGLGDETQRGMWLAPAGGGSTWDTCTFIVAPLDFRWTMLFHDDNCYFAYRAEPDPEATEK